MGSGGKKQENENRRTMRQKAWGNFWFYNKHCVLGGIVVLAVLACYGWEIGRKKKLDYELALVCSETVSDRFREALEDGLERHLQDRNGDGQVVVRVNSYYFGAGKRFEEEKDADRLMGGAVQLAADLELGISMVYITDDFETLNTGTEGGFQEERLEWETSEVLTGKLVAAVREEEGLSEEKILEGRELWKLLKEGYQSSYQK